MTWQDITIAQYQQLYPILSRKIADLCDELEQKQDIIGFFEGKPKEHYDTMKAKAFDELWANYEFLTKLPEQTQPNQIIRIDGHIFLMDYNSANVKERLTGKDVVDLSTIAGNEQLVTQKMDVILFGYLKYQRKRFWHKEPTDKQKLDLIRKIDMDTAYNLTAFFLPLLDSYLAAIQTFSTELLNQTQSWTEKSLQTP